MKSPRTPESVWRLAGLKWLKIRFGGRLWHYRTVGGVGQRSGVPDDLFLIDGIFLAIEWKRPEYKPRPGIVTQQDVEIEAILSCGGRAGKVRNWDELEALVAGIQAKHLSMGRIG